MRATASSLPRLIALKVSTTIIARWEWIRPLGNCVQLSRTLSARTVRNRICEISLATTILGKEAAVAAAEAREATALTAEGARARARVMEADAGAGPIMVAPVVEGQGDSGVDGVRVRTAEGARERERAREKARGKVGRERARGKAMGERGSPQITGQHQMALGDQELSMGMVKGSGKGREAGHGTATLIVPQHNQHNN